MAPATRLRRKRKHALRQMADAILWLLRTDCQWRNLPPDGPQWRAVYYYFDQWKNKAPSSRLMPPSINWIEATPNAKPVLQYYVLIHNRLSCRHRLTAIAVSTPTNGSTRGRPCGRKRTVVVDPQGRLWLADVNAANQADGPLAKQLSVSILWRAGDRLEKIFGDQAYNGVFAGELVNWRIDFEKAARPESACGFVLVAKRWVVEPVRRCGSVTWTNQFRRIVKGYEPAVSSWVSWLHLANSQIVLQRIERCYQR